MPTSHRLLPNPFGQLRHFHKTEYRCYCDGELRIVAFCSSLCLKRPTDAMTFGVREVSVTAVCFIYWERRIFHTAVWNNTVTAVDMLSCSVCDVQTAGSPLNPVWCQVANTGWKYSLVDIVTRQGFGRSGFRFKAEERNFSQFRMYSPVLRPSQSLYNGGSFFGAISGLGVNIRNIQPHVALRVKIGGYI